MATTSRHVAALVFALLSMLVAPEVRAQNDVVVTTTVKPPYSPYLSDYVGFDNKIVVTLKNTTNTPLNVRLVGQVKGSTGVTVTIPNTFVPAAPIVLGPNQTRMLQGVQLKEYLDPNNLQFSGITKQEVMQGNGLPEGNYSLCLRALDYAGNTPRSLPSPSGCANFSITHYEPPTLTAPACNSSVQPKLPQNVLFTWTIPAGAPPAKVEYVLKIVEMIPANINPAQAMAAATDPPFFQTTLGTTSFQYGPAQPKLIPGHRYAVRITAKNKGVAKDLFFKNSGHSVVCAFTYGEQLADEGGQGGDGQGDNDGGDEGDDEQDGDDEPVDVEEQYANPCTALNCAPQPLPASTPSNTVYQVGDEVKIGYFTMKLTSLSSATAGNLSGEGEIDAPIFHTKLKATFTGLKVNPDHKVYSGKAIGSYDPGAQVDEALRNFTNNLENIAADKVKSLADYVKDKGKYIEDFVDVNATGLPFAWKKMVNSKLQLVSIASVEFAPDGARFNAFLEMPLPEANNQILAFAQKNVCFHPTGLSVDGLQKLTMLGADRTFAWGDKIDVTLKAANGQNGTYVKWDCQGYKEMQIEGFFTLKSSMIEKADGGGNVKASFKFSNAAAWGDMLGEVTMDAFYVKGMRGLKFTFTKVVLDFSDTRNAQGMVFPANHEGAKGNDWRGFYFKEMKALLPKSLKRDGKQVEISLKDVLIGKTGVTGTGLVQPVFAVGAGSVGGWGFSMDKFEISLLNNSLTKGAFNGKLKMPVAKTEIAYSCVLASTDTTLNMMFAVNPTDDIEVDMWGAKLVLEDGSNVSVTTVGDDVTVKAVLTGMLTIDKKFAEMKNVSLKIPDVRFEEFTIQNKAPYVSAKLFKLASPEKSFAGFPVSIDPNKGDGIQAMFLNEGKKAGLKLTFHVGLDGNGQSAISGGTSFTVWGKMQEVNGKQVWSADKPTFDSIGIGVEGPVTIKGSVRLYNGDPTFGDGFRGAVMVKFGPLAEIAATVQFGNTKYKSNSNYRYWYVDAMCRLEQGIPIFTGFGLYGFGGGAYYHMKPQAVMPAASALEGNAGSVTNFNQDEAGKTTTGVVYLPDPGVKLGLKGSLVLGTMPKDNVFNGDINLEATFYDGGGVDFKLAGKGFFFQPANPKARPADNKALVTITVDFAYSSQLKAFDGKLGINFNVQAGNLSLVKGGGDATMHFSKDKWFIKLGEPAPDKRIGLTILNKIDINSYFMVGKNSLPGMPPLPADLAAKLPSFNNDNPRKPQTSNGSGFAFGQELDINTGKLKFLIFYAQIAIRFGYDISVLNEVMECEEAVGGYRGFNGWYAKGRVYADFLASLGIDINLWFLKADIKLLEVGVTAALEANLPNPTMLKGEASGHFEALGGALHGEINFKFKYGEVCSSGGGDPFGGVKVISEIRPSSGNADVFSFPEVAYNLPLNEPMTVDVQDANDPEKFTKTTFRFGLRDLKVVNMTKKANLEGVVELSSRKLSSIFYPDDMLAETTPHRVRVSVYGQKFVNNKWTMIGQKNNPNVEHLEKDSADFTTGTAPEYFRNDQIISSIPGRMQRYFLRKQVTQGQIAFRQFPSNIPAMEPKEKEYKFTYVARFQELGAGSVVVGTTPLVWEPQAGKKRVSFDLPPGLKQEKTYIIQFVRRKVLKNPKPVTELASGSDDDGISTKDEKVDVGGGQKINLRRRKIDAIKLGDDEFLVYQLAFRTSQFENFSKKINNYMAGDPEMSTGTGDYSNTIYARLKGDEPFDWYDLHQSSYNVGQEEKKYIMPLIRTEAVYLGNTNDSYWAQLRSQYMMYMQDKSFANKIRYDYNHATKQDYVDPATIRQYPSANAYLPGSRLTNGNIIADSVFPRNAVGLSYEGNASATKLTNAEINATYWNGMEQYGDDGNDGGSMAVLNVLAVAGEGNGGGNPHLLPNMDLKQATSNKLVIRYDVATVINKDRERVHNALKSEWGSANRFDNASLNFVRFNSPTLWYNSSSAENPDYWSGKVKKVNEFPVTVEYGYGSGTSNGRRIDLHP